MIGYALEGVERVLGVIPARGGSVRFAGKNLSIFRGKSLLEWAVESGRGSKYIDDLFVSSEDEGILEEAARLGCQAIVRPEDLATGSSCSEAVLMHALCSRGFGLVYYEWLVLLQPTSPLRTSADIDACLAHGYGGNGCLSVTGGIRNGAVYVVRTSSFLANLSLDTGLTYEMAEGLDVDYAHQLADV